MTDTEEFAGSESAESAATGGAKVGSAGHEASLWGDAWRQLRRNPLFLLSAFAR
jgi:hypothetical protein